jgi:hypothetical protein
VRQAKDYGDVTMNTMKLFLLFLTAFGGIAYSEQETPDQKLISDLSRHLYNADEPNLHLRGSEDLMRTDPDDFSKKDVIALKDAKMIIADYDSLDMPVSRTATGGFVNTIMVALTVFAFLGNGAFMVYVFWLSK